MTMLLPSLENMNEDIFLTSSSSTNILPDKSATSFLLSSSSVNTQFIRVGISSSCVAVALERSSSSPVVANLFATVRELPNWEIPIGISCCDYLFPLVLLH